jgi:hypothetical protein
LGASYFRYKQHCFFELFNLLAFNFVIVNTQKQDKPQNEQDIVHKDVTSELPEEPPVEGGLLSTKSEPQTTQGAFASSNDHSDWLPLDTSADLENCI